MVLRLNVVPIFTGKGDPERGVLAKKGGKRIMSRWLLGWLQKVRFTCGWILVVVCSCTGSRDI